MNSKQIPRPSTARYKSLRQRGKSCMQKDRFPSALTTVPDPGEKVGVTQPLPRFIIKTARLGFVRLDHHKDFAYAGVLHHPQPSIVLAPEEITFTSVHFKWTQKIRLEASIPDFGHRVRQFDAAVIFTKGILNNILREPQILHRDAVRLRIRHGSATEYSWEEIIINIYSTFPSQLAEMAVFGVDVNSKPLHYIEMEEMMKRVSSNSFDQNEQTVTKRCPKEVGSER